MPEQTLLGVQTPWEEPHHFISPEVRNGQRPLAGRIEKARDATQLFGSMKRFDPDERFRTGDPKLPRPKVLKHERAGMMKYQQFHK
jgi:hypothetical protein